MLVITTLRTFAGRRTAQASPNGPPMSWTTRCSGSLMPSAVISASTKFGHAFERVVEIVRRGGPSEVRQVGRDATVGGTQGRNYSAPHFGRVGIPVQEQDGRALALIDKMEVCSVDVQLHVKVPL